MTDLERELLAAHPVVEDQSRLRERGLTSLDHLFAASSYHDAVLLKDAIHRWKYSRLRSLGGHLGSLLSERAPQIDGHVVICPVPLHWTRLFQRGFNQAAILARMLADHRGLHVHDLLTRTRPTGHQAWRKRPERFRAMENVFRCRTSNPPQHVLVIDDLSTTGATLDACARALKNAGCERVEGWVVAHG